MDEQLWQRFQNGDRRSLARLLTLVAQGRDLQEIARKLPRPETSSRVAALTGSGGVGKSSLTGKLIESWRRQDKRVAVLACDPQSPLSGGALLGDRFRMPSVDDDGVFIRSIAASSGHGAIAEHLDLMIRLFESFGFDLILIETVGAGQGDTTVSELADVVVLLLQPETGDDLQWEKAGVLEVADLIVVHKADLPNAAQVVAQVKNTVALSTMTHPSVLAVSSKTGEGVEELARAIEASPLRRHDASDLHELLAATQRLLTSRFAAAEGEHQQEFIELVERWQSGTIDNDGAASQLLTLLASSDYAVAGRQQTSD